MLNAQRSCRGGRHGSTPSGSGIQFAKNRMPDSSASLIPNESGCRSSLARYLTPVFHPEQNWQLRSLALGVALRDKLTKTFAPEANESTYRAMIQPRWNCRRKCFLWLATTSQGLAWYLLFARVGHQRRVPIASRFHVFLSSDGKDIDHGHTA
jgi:hypothetical protein